MVVADAAHLTGCIRRSHKSTHRRILTSRALSFSDFDSSPRPIDLGTFLNAAEPVPQPNCKFLLLLSFLPPVVEMQARNLPTLISLFQSQDIARGRSRRPVPYLASRQKSRNRPALNCPAPCLTRFVHLFLGRLWHTGTYSHTHMLLPSLRASLLVSLRDRDHHQPCPLSTVLLLHTQLNRSSVPRPLSHPARLENLPTDFSRTLT